MAEQTTPAASPCGTPGGGSGGSGSNSGGGDSGGVVQGGSQDNSQWMSSVSMIAVFVLIFYFFIIRPQRKKQKQQDTLISGLTRGDQIITVGGFLGTVREVRDDTFVIEIADGVKARILKSAVQTKRVASPARAGDGGSEQINVG